MTSGISIPVLMYHSVGRIIDGWKWSFLTVPPPVFEDQLRWLKMKGYRSIDHDELYDHVSGMKPLSEKHVVLTFDDGYLDNWTYAAPLLKKYGFKAVVYVNPDFVDPREVVRTTLEDVWQGRCREGDLEVRGFMSWPELRRITDDGVFSVQSHLMTHTWYPVSSRIVDFHHPGDEYYWLGWNYNPEQKPFYLKGPWGGAVPWGHPVYEHAKAAVARIVTPDSAEIDHLVRFTAGQGGEEFFRRGDWKDLLFAEAERYRSVHPPAGSTESEEKYLERLDIELKESRTVLEQRLGRPVEFLAWPGGGYDEQAVARSLSVYKAVTLGSRDRSGVRNRPGENPRLVKRCGVPYVEKNGAVVYQGGRYLYHYLREHQGGGRIHRLFRQGLKLTAHLK